MDSIAAAKKAIVKKITFVVLIVALTLSDPFERTLIFIYLHDYFMRVGINILIKL